MVAMTRPAHPALLVGREPELDMLRAAFDDGTRGEPRVVMIRGEAGIGKTRLVQEFLASVADEGRPAMSVHVAIGQCADVGTIGTPFFSVRRLLRSLHRSVGDDALRAAAGSPGTVAILGALVPELGGERAAAAPNTPDVLADAIEQVIVHLSVEHHLVLVIEDLHWADASTIDLLKTLTITERGAHITVLCTFRTEDLPRGHLLHGLLASLDRNPAVHSVDLHRLAPDQTAQIVEQLAPSIPDEAAESIIARSQGVPFFAEELLDLPDGALPDTLRGVIMARVGEASSSSRAVLGMLSVGGEKVDHVRLAEVADIDVGDLSAALRELIDRNLIVTADHAYAFRHALIREAVLDDLLPGERSALHRWFAEVLQAQVDAGELELAAETAEHWLRARDIPRAFDATVAARIYARASLAFIGAIEQGERLLDLWPETPDAATRAGMSLADLAADILTDLNIVGGDTSRAQRCARLALGQLGADDPQGRADIHRLVGVILSNAEQLPESLSELATARALVEPLSGPRRDATMAKIMSMDLITDREAHLDVTARLAEECITLATASRSASAIETVSTHAAWALADRGAYARAAEVIARVPLTASGLNSQTVSTHVLYWLGRYGDSSARALETLDLADAAGIGTSGALMFIRLNRAAALAAQGLPHEATVALDAAARSVPARGASRTLDWLRYERSQQALWGGTRVLPHDVVPSYLEWYPQEAAEDMTSRAVEFLAAAADAHTPKHRRDAVAAAIDVLAPFGGEPYFTLSGLLRYAVVALSWGIATAVDIGLDEARLAPLRVALATACDTLGDDPAAHALRAFADAELARSRGESCREVVDGYRAALALADEGFMHVRHRQLLRLRLAQALVDDGQTDAAAGLIDEIRATAPEQGVALVARWATELAGRAGIRLAREDAGATADALTSLTSREREVLALVAEGLSNSEIGRRLFISPKTASVHVSAILTKLGASNRAEAAARYVAAQHAVAPASSSTSTSTSTPEAAGY